MSFIYNVLDQLLTAVTERGGAEERRVTYEYDVNGNQVKESDTKTSVTTVNEYDADNRLSKAVVTMPGAESLPDSSSEPVSGLSAETSQGEDSAGQLKTITQENLYNGNGQRILKSEGAKETNYFYQDGAVSYTTEGSGDTKAIQNLLGLEDNVILAESDSRSYYLYNKDIQGSTTSVLNADGTDEVSYEYDDFGETEINGNSVFQNEICYTGGIYDETTGLYYLNARYYDPENGRFLTEDTYRGEVKEPDTLHLYVYCKNNPVNYVDPSGHKWVKFESIKKKKTSKAKTVMSRYKKNMEQNKSRKYNKVYSNQFINNQNSLGFIKFRSSNIGKTGCGIIATYNLLKLCGKYRDFFKLVAEFDYHMTVNGKFGIIPRTVGDAINGYQKAYYETNVGWFSALLQKKKYGIMLYMAPGIVHYVTVKKTGKKITVYNLHDKSKIYPSIKDTLKKERGIFQGGFVTR